MLGVPSLTNWLHFSITGKHLEWVACGKCWLWFHLICVGILDPAIVKDPDYEFYCKKCLRNPQQPASDGPQQAE